MFPNPTMFCRGDRSAEVERPIDMEVVWFKYQAFRLVCRVPCFWCGTLLLRKEATCDHVIPRSRGGTRYDGNLEIACLPCNESRAALSQIAGRIRVVMQNRNQKPLQSRKSLLRRLLDDRERMLPMLLDLERLYHQRLTGRRLRVCLSELDEVLRAEVRR